MAKTIGDIATLASATTDEHAGHADTNCLTFGIAANEHARHADADDFPKPAGLARAEDEYADANGESFTRRDGGNERHGGYAGNGHGEHGLAAGDVRQRHGCS